jgi:hypothetical protein
MRTEEQEGKLRTDHPSERPEAKSQSQLTWTSPEERKRNGIVKISGNNNANIVSCAARI